MPDDVIFYEHLVHFAVFCDILCTLGIVRGNLVYLIPVLVFCTKKNLATLLQKLFSITVRRQQVAFLCIRDGGENFADAHNLQISMIIFFGKVLKMANFRRASDPGCQIFLGPNIPNL
jgi:hypothetical protein